jgi:hypothetical protein
MKLLFCGIVAVAIKAVIIVSLTMILQKVSRNTCGAEFSGYVSFTVCATQRH